MNEYVIIEGKTSKPKGLIIGGLLCVLGGFILLAIVSYYHGEFEGFLRAIGAILFFGGFFLAIYGIIDMQSYKKTSITVTNKRVYGIIKWSKSVELPLDMISAVGMSSNYGIDVSTSSGRIHFKRILNNQAIYSAISTLLLERQSPVVAQHSVPPMKSELQSHPSQSTNDTEWICECGKHNTGMFCSTCGKSKQSITWICKCGTLNDGNFCTSCGNSKRTK